LAISLNNKDAENSKSMGRWTSEFIYSALCSFLGSCKTIVGIKVPWQPEFRSKGIFAEAPEDFPCSVLQHIFDPS
jgi:hypothetical protein